MRYTLFIIFSLVLCQTQAQTTSLGTSTTLDVEGNAMFYFGGSTTFNGSVTNIGTTIVEQDAQINGPVDNSGTMEIRGDAAIAAASIVNNESGSTFGIRGNASLDGNIINNGQFFVSGGLNSVINGSIDNNSELKFDADLQINGVIDNTGEFGVVGNVMVAGTLLNPDGAETTITGDLNLTTPFINGGKLSATGDAIISNDFTNINEARFSGSATFDGITTNDQMLVLAANTSFNGELINNGSIVSVADAELNFVNNKQLGILSFTDIEGRTPITEVILLSSADSIFIDELNLNTIGTITLPPNFVLVQSALNLEKGILNATNQETFLVQGSINVNATNDSSPSYVEGTMLAVTSSSNTTVFPMGINGFPNFVAINSTTPGIIVKVQCKLPNPDSLLTDENTMGLAQEVEWIIQSLADSAEVSVSVSYSGVDFRNTPNFINAREYDATLQRFGKGDSVFHALHTIASNNTNTGTSISEQGTIQTSNKIWISPSPTRFALGISPVLTEPEVYLPNVFAPGATHSDNQTFRPFIGGATVSSVSFLIYDSFNREVYAETLAGEDLNLEDLGWDGSLNSGLEAPEGVYYYKVNISYNISEDVSDKYFNSGERDQVQSFSKLGSVLLVK